MMKMKDDTLAKNGRTHAVLGFLFMEDDINTSQDIALLSAINTNFVATKDTA